MKIHSKQNFPRHSSQEVPNKMMTITSAVASIALNHCRTEIWFWEKTAMYMGPEPHCASKKSFESSGVPGCTSTYVT